MVECIHHWDLGSSQKGIVHAKCRKCGAEKDFNNTPVFNPGTFRGKKKVIPLPITPAGKATD